jgi:ABC-type branched-subunit amino acid transport system ATPase component
MNSAEVDIITKQILELRDDGYTIILVEHQMPVVMGVSDRILVMNKGELLTQGTPQQILKDEEVIKAYLGVQHEAGVEVKPRRASMVIGQPQLSLKDISAGYGHVRVLKGVNLDVYKGEIVTLLGANAAGKSTTIKTILGAVRPTHGTIEFEGNQIAKKNTVDIIKGGMAVVPEGRRIFWRLTVEENLEMGAFSKNDPALVKSGIERAYELFPILKERRKQKGGTLSGGEQQMLAIARAIMIEPSLLLLDEPSMGLSPVLVAQVMETVQRINKEWGTTIFMVEQNANEALKIADRGYVLQTGSIVITDSAANLLVDDAMKAAYLGG